MRVCGYRERERIHNIYIGILLCETIRVTAPGVALRLERNHVATELIELRFKPTTFVSLTLRKYPNIHPANSTAGGLVESID